jgi:TDG/mug DNA glycosylase family protein
MPRTPSKSAAASPSPRKTTPKKRPAEDEAEEQVEASPRKRRDRFNGLSDEQVMEKRLPDRLAPNLDIVIVGINPGLLAAYEGHHYVGPGNHFWKCVELSGLVPKITDKPLNAYDDDKLLEHGIGFTTIVARPTKGSGDLTRKEIREGVEILTEKIRTFKPKIVVFNGKGIYEIFSGKKEFNFGKQPDKIEGADTVVWVMPSSSARCAQLPRAVDKVPYDVALRKLKEHLRGELPNLDDSEVVFPDLLKGNGQSEKSEKNGTDE